MRFRRFDLPSVRRMKVIAIYSVIVVACHSAARIIQIGHSYDVRNFSARGTRERATPPLPPSFSHPLDASRVGPAAPDSLVTAAPAPPVPSFHQLSTPVSFRIPYFPFSTGFPICLLYHLLPFASDPRSSSFITPFVTPRPFVIVVALKSVLFLLSIILFLPLYPRRISRLCSLSLLFLFFSGALLSLAYRYFSSFPLPCSCHLTQFLISE